MLRTNTPLALSQHWHAHPLTPSFGATNRKQVTLTDTVGHFRANPDRSFYQLDSESLAQEATAIKKDLQAGRIPNLTQAFSQLVDAAIAKIESGQQAQAVGASASRWALPEQSAMAQMLTDTKNTLPKRWLAEVPAYQQGRILKTGDGLVLQDPRNPIACVTGIPHYYVDSLELLRPDAMSNSTKLIPQSSRLNTALHGLQTMGFVNDIQRGSRTKLVEALPPPRQVEEGIQVLQECGTSAKFVNFLMAQAIPSGRLGVGQLPTTTELGNALGVSPRLVSTALRPLERGNPSLLLRQNPNTPCEINPEAITNQPPIWEATDDQGEPVLLPQVRTLIMPSVRALATQFPGVMKNSPL
jgi:hypothetical protein